MTTPATSQRLSPREFLVTRLIHAPAPAVFEAWTKPEVFREWWIPKSMPMALQACEIDARTGGRYRLAIGMDGKAFEFFGRYLEVAPPSRLAWTNEEGGEEEAAVTTVTFEPQDGKTLVKVHDLYPTEQALDAAIANGSTEGMPAQLAQLDELIGRQG